MRDEAAAHFKLMCAACTYGGRTYGGRTYGGRTYGGRTYGGRTYGGRTYGGRTYGGQRLIIASLNGWKGSNIWEQP
jgi:hypothetical protein